MKTTLVWRIPLALLACLGSSRAITDIEIEVHPGYDVKVIHPQDFKVPVGGMEFLPDGRLLVLGWRGSLGPESGAGMADRTVLGDLYALSNVKTGDAATITAKKIADGFKDALGIAYVQGSIYVGDIDRLIKLVDKDGDGYFETKETFAVIPSYNGWFEFSFGPVYKEGKFYMALAGAVAPGGSPVKQKGPGRSQVLSIDMQGVVTPFAGGFRAPDGIAWGPEGDLFVTDNQGFWEPSSKLVHVQKGHNYGYKVDPPDEFSTQPVTAPAVWLPYGAINNSATQPALMPTGLYKDQLFFGDVKRGGIRRMFLEKIKGVWQGAVFPFTGGTEAGVHRLLIDGDGVLYAGGLGRDVWENWNGKLSGLQKFSPNGKGAFEMLSVRARKNGMEIEFTQPVADGADQIANYKVRTAEMWPQDSYGGGNMQNSATLEVRSAKVSGDGKKVFLELPGLTTHALGRVVNISVPTLKSKEGKPLWFNETWYTLTVPGDTDPFAVPVALAKPPIGKFREVRLVSRNAGGGRFIFRVAGALDRSALEIRDVTGKGVFSGRLDASGECLVDASSWARGVYLVQAGRDGSIASSGFYRP